jgi:hypothetical protein
MAEKGFFRGAGGVVFEMDLPLPEVMQEQVTKQLLVRVNSDGTPYTGEAEGPAEGATPAHKPALNASKTEWIGWAVSQGADHEDAAAATKQDLIDAYGDKSEE